MTTIRQIGVSSITYMSLPAYAYSKDWRAMLVDDVNGVLKPAAALAGLTVWDQKSRKDEEEGVTYQS